VIRSDDSVELSFHCAHEHSVGRERAPDVSHARRWRKNVFVLGPEPSAVAAVRVQRAQRDPWLGDGEPLPQSVPRDPRSQRDALNRHRVSHVTERDVRRSQHDTKRMTAASRGAGRRQHHRHRCAGEGTEHLGVPRVIESAGKQR